MKSYRHILCATDFSPVCDLVYAYAAQLARESGAKLTLLHVVAHFPVDRSNEAIAPEDVDPKEFHEQRARMQLQAKVARIGYPETTPEVIFGARAPGHEIIHYADAHGVDLIVVAGHEHKGITARLISTVAAIRAHAACEVMVLPAQEASMRRTV